MKSLAPRLGPALLAAAAWAWLFWLAKGDPAWKTACLVASAVAMAFLWRALSSERFFRRMIVDTTAEQLAFIRVVVCLVALLMTSIENLPALADVPAGLGLPSPPGLMSLLGSTDAYRWLVSSRAGLGALQLLIVALLLAGAFGWRTRFALPLSAAGFLLMGTILRHYTYVFHSGLVPLYLLIVLSLTPCADAWSPGALPRRERLERKSRGVYGWSRYACLSVIALPYLMAGMHKLCRWNALDFFDPINFQTTLLTDSFEPIFFGRIGNPALWLHRANIPWLFTLLAVFAVCAEVGYVSVLFSRRARGVLPLIMGAFHAGILLFQNILFPDLIVLQAVVFEGASRRAAPRQGPAQAPRDRWGPGLIAVLISSALLVWSLRIERFPLTSWPLYEQPRHPPVRYLQMTALLSDATTADIPSAQYAVAALPNGRSILANAFKPEKAPAFGCFLERFCRRYNERVSEDKKIVRLEVQSRVWDLNATTSEGFPGRIEDRFVFDPARAGPQCARRD